MTYDGVVGPQGEYWTRPGAILSSPLTVWKEGKAEIVEGGGPGGSAGGRMIDRDGHPMRPKGSMNEVRVFGYTQLQVQSASFSVSTPLPRRRLLTLPLCMFFLTSGLISLPTSEQ
jgi:hypothetical protein